MPTNMECFAHDLPCAPLDKPSNVGYTKDVASILIMVSENRVRESC